MQIQITPITALPRAIYLAVLAATCPHTNTAAQPAWDLSAYTTPTAPEISDRYGIAVDVHANLAIIGSENDNHLFFDAGSVYIVDISDPLNPQTLSQLIASDTAEDDLFGRTVTISENLAAVGATGVDGPSFISGAVYLFDLTDPHNPIETAKIPAPPSLNSERFGSSIAISGNRMVIGETGADDFSQDSGSAYLYDISDPSNPIKIAKMLASGSGINENFGNAAAIDGNTALVCAALHNNNGPDAGRVYAYDITNPVEPFTQTTDFAAADTVFRDKFGNAIDCANGIAIIGAFNDNNTHLDAGAAYLFDITDPANPIELSKIQAPDAADTDLFGQDVAIDGNIAVIGSRSSPAAEPSLGSVYFFDVSDPTQPVFLNKLAPYNGDQQDGFGAAVAIAGNNALIGAPYASFPGTTSGAAYIAQSCDPFTPGSFDIAEPTLGQVVSGAEIPFRWDRVICTDAYRLTIFNDQSIFNPEVDIFVTEPEALISAATFEPETAYNWRVTAFGNPWTIPALTTGAFVTASEDIFLNNPAENTVIESILPLTFSWTTQGFGHNFYQLIIDDTPTFASPIIDTPTTSPDFDLSPFTLDFSTTYHWRVIANTPSGTIISSPISRTFHTAPPPIPGAYSITAPSPGAVLNPLDPHTFSWSSSFGATEYRLLIDDNPDFSSPEIDDTTDQLEHTVDAFLLPPLASLSCRVIASNPWVPETTPTPTIAISTTDAERPPNSPNLLTPPITVEEIDPTTDILFQWSNPANADRFVYQMATDAFFNTLILEIDTGLSPNYTLPANTLPTDNAAYYWRVLAFNTAGFTISNPAWRRLRVGPPVPSVFNLLLPEDDATIDPHIATLFDWAGTFDADSYHLMIDDNPNLTSPEINLDTGSATIIVIPDDTFDFSTTYYWSVAAINEHGSTTPAPRSFTTITPTPPAPFALLSPPDPSTGIPTFDTTFEWEPATDAEQYTLLVDDDIDFISPVIDETITTTSLTTSGELLSPGQQYYWAVIASNFVGTTDATPTPASFITEGPAPAAPLLVLPTNGAITTTDQVQFQWIAGQHAHSHVIEIDDDPAFTSPLISVNVGPPIGGIEQYTTPPGILTNAVYEWRILAINLIDTTPSTPASHTLEITGVPSGCEGDANGDNTVDVNDISYVLFRLGSTGPDGDANNDGSVDVNDISYVLFRLADPCP